MGVFKNRLWTKRDYECTNVVACVAEAKPETDNDRWEPAEEAILAPLTHLWTERGVRYYGYL